MDHLEDTRTEDPDPVYRSKDLFCLSLVTKTMREEVESHVYAKIGVLSGANDQYHAEEVEMRWLAERGKMDISKPIMNDEYDLHLLCARRISVLVIELKRRVLQSEERAGCLYRTSRKLSDRLEDPNGP